MIHPIPLQPGDVVVLAVGVVVAILAVAEFVAGEDHRRAQRQQHHAEQVLCGAFAFRRDNGIIARSFDAEVVRPVRIRAVVVVLAVGLVVLVRVHGQIVERETVMACDEVHGGGRASARIGGEQVRRSAQSCGHFLHADGVALLLVGFGKPEGA